jgi:IS5 family transposase
VERILDQTRRRVFAGEKMPSDEKMLSLVEPHTKAVLRHTTAKQVECGRQVMLDDVDGGIITCYEILEHPTEHGQALFARPPTLVVADRGVHATDTEARLRQLGVTHVAIPASGTVSAERRARRCCGSQITVKAGRSVRGGAVGKGPRGTSLAAYSTHTGTSPTCCLATDSGWSSSSPCFLEVS